jgi:hypothetical protein
MHKQLEECEDIALELAKRKKHIEVRFLSFICLARLMNIIPPLSFLSTGDSRKDENSQFKLTITTETDSGEKKESER